LTRTERKPKVFEKTLRQVGYWWRQEEEQRLFDELMARLREEYAGSVTLFEENLVAMHAESNP
jgi:hypothetical protein